MDFEYDFHSNHDLSLNKNFFKTKGLSGIINTMNKCYSNSIIQCLSHTLKFTDFMLSNKLQNEIIESNLKSKKEYPVLNSFKLLLIKLWNTNELIIPNMFYKNLYEHLQKYNNVQQQDSHEFLLDILELLHKALSYKIDVTISGEVLNETDNLTKNSLMYWKKTYENEYSQIVELFNGMSVNLIECKNCHYESNSIFESFNTINLNILNTPSCSLSNCLDNFFTQSNIDDWKCDKCNNIGCTESLNLWSLPNYLIIQLKRFDNNGIKINNLIDFPIDDLDLTQYILPKKNDPNNYIYNLYAINYHSGNINNGHYWSSIRNLDNNWYILNDGHISKYSNNSDMKMNLVTSNAYLLFYYRKMITKK
jgi:ubiquitin C-terminal hydrolase